jgi:hypothetical protein
MDDPLEKRTLRRPATADEISSERFPEPLSIEPSNLKTRRPEIRERVDK